MGDLIEDVVSSHDLEPRERPLNNDQLRRILDWSSYERGRAEAALISCALFSHSIKEHEAAIRQDALYRDTMRLLASSGVIATRTPEVTAEQLLAIAEYVQRLEEDKDVDLIRYDNYVAALRHFGVLQLVEVCSLAEDAVPPFFERDLSREIARKKREEWRETCNTIKVDGQIGVAMGLGAILAWSIAVWSLVGGMRIEHHKAWTTKPSVAKSPLNAEVIEQQSPHQSQPEDR